MHASVNRRSLLLGLGAVGASLYFQDYQATQRLSSNQTDADFAPEIQRRLNEAVDRRLNSDNIPGAIIGVWMPGQGRWLAAKGISDRRTQTPMQLDNHFRIGSVTKTTTITAILQLAELQQLSLQDPVGKYLPFVPNGEKITLEMLANMTSGLYSYTFDPDFQYQLKSNPSRVWKPRELVEIAFTHGPQAAPGSKWEYNNTNTVLLAMVVERVARKPLQQVFQEQIFTPLGLRHTIFPTTATLPTPYTHGYTEQTLDGQQGDASFWNPSWAWGTGNLISTLEDLKIYAGAIATGKGLISSATQQYRLTWATLPPNTQYYRYGIGIVYNQGWLGHTGSLPGYNTVMFHLPEKDTTMVIMANSDICANQKTPCPGAVAGDHVSAHPRKHPSDTPVLTVKPRR
ncbi:serine hydrolase domain-containing protein [Neosynechococcus sphagnicola]|uniref:serine hydrolase domain-containing protein n=1 Tax=Neosynechococcus sphagnicola TaxID=1501145 RepID=UPI00068C7DBB|nr:serine hydrolase domain-containing protein [Neosynechococcus sphagnicola]